MTDKLPPRPVEDALGEALRRWRNPAMRPLWADAGEHKRHLWQCEAGTVVDLLAEMGFEIVPANTAIEMDGRPKP